MADVQNNIEAVSQSVSDGDRRPWSTPVIVSERTSDATRFGTNGLSVDSSTLNNAS
jgi:hypothetical protein